jgi:hypothetical protein
VIATGHDLRATGGATDEPILTRIRSSWRERTDRSSKLHPASTEQRQKTEMSYIGGYPHDPTPQAGRVPTLPARLTGRTPTARTHPRSVSSLRSPVNGHVRLTDAPAAGRGRTYLVESELEQYGNAALCALVTDYTDQANLHGAVPMHIPIQRDLDHAPG